MFFRRIKAKWRYVQDIVKLEWNNLKVAESISRRNPSIKLLVGFAIATVCSTQAIPGDAKNEDKQQRHNQNQAQKAQGRSDNQAHKEVRKDNRQAAQQVRSDNRQDNRRTTQAAKSVYQAQRNDQRNDRRDDRRSSNLAQNRADDQAQAQRRATNRAQNQVQQNRRDDRKDDKWDARNDRRDDRRDDRAQNRTGHRWDYRLDNRNRYQVYRKYRNNWNQQRAYLNANLNQFNQLAQLNQLQQAQLESQMRAAYLAYHNNHYNGAYNWSNYSQPQFLDYLQTRRPSLLQSILSALGLGNNNNYLYSDNWDSERSQLSQNMANIHQLAVSGRITPSQERELMNQLRPEFMSYHNNNWDGQVDWSNYSDPGFVDYLNTRRPTILTTIRDYLVM